MGIPPLCCKHFQMLDYDLSLAKPVVSGLPGLNIGSLYTGMMSIEIK